MKLAELQEYLNIEYVAKLIKILPNDKGRIDHIVLSTGHVHDIDTLIRDLALGDRNAVSKDGQLYTIK